MTDKTLFKVCTTVEIVSAVYLAYKALKAEWERHKAVNRALDAEINALYLEVKCMTKDLEIKQLKKKLNEQENEES